MKPVEGDLKDGLELDRLRMYAIAKHKTEMANAKTMQERIALLKAKSSIAV